MWTYNFSTSRPLSWVKCETNHLLNERFDFLLDNECELPTPTPEQIVAVIVWPYSIDKNSVFNHRLRFVRHSKLKTIKYPLIQLRSFLPYLRFFSSLCGRFDVFIYFFVRSLVRSFGWAIYFIYMWIGAYNPQFDDFDVFIVLPYFITIYCYIWCCDWNAECMNKWHTHDISSHLMRLGFGVCVQIKLHFP